MRDCRDPVELLWTRARALGPRLGPVLFQFPPRFPADLERLRAFLPVLPRGMRAAFEFRDPPGGRTGASRGPAGAGPHSGLAARPGPGSRATGPAEWPTSGSLR